MNEYARLYRQTYTTFGYDLTDIDGISETSLARFERKMGFRLPRALREFYLVAGNEPEFNSVHDRLLTPPEWGQDAGKLIFMEENQAVVVWGVDLVKNPAPDPPVFQGVNGDPIEWHVEIERCSVFLTVMLHWQGAFGGAMGLTRTAVAPQTLRDRLDAEWSFAGEVNGMRAYNRSGRAICFLKWEDDWRIFAGAATDRLLSQMSRELDLAWDAANCD